MRLQQKEPRRTPWPFFNTLFPLSLSHDPSSSLPPYPHPLTLTPLSLSHRSVRRPLPPCPPPLHLRLPLLSPSCSPSVLPLLVDGRWRHCTSAHPRRPDARSILSWRAPALRPSLHVRLCLFALAASAGSASLAGAPPWLVLAASHISPVPAFVQSSSSPLPPLRPPAARAPLALLSWPPALSFPIRQYYGLKLPFLPACFLDRLTRARVAAGWCKRATSRPRTPSATPRR